MDLKCNKRTYVVKAMSDTAILYDMSMSRLWVASFSTSFAVFESMHCKLRGSEQVRPLRGRHNLPCFFPCLRLPCHFLRAFHSPTLLHLRCRCRHRKCSRSSLLLDVEWYQTVRTVLIWMVNSSVQHLASSVTLDSRAAKYSPAAFSTVLLPYTMRGDPNLLSVALREYK